MPESQSSEERHEAIAHEQWLASHVLASTVDEALFDIDEYVVGSPADHARAMRSPDEELKLRGWHHLTPGMQRVFGNASGGRWTSNTEQLTSATAQRAHPLSKLTYEEIKALPPDALPPVAPPLPPKS